VMSPVYEASLDSPHSRVACVECHIGSGAGSFVRSKMSGMRQLLAVMFSNYERPIPTPVHNLRPADETCEQCHSPHRFTQDRLFVRHHYADNEGSSRTTNVLLMKVGGVRPDGTASGIHWHSDPRNKITYVSTDSKRTKIPWVRFVDRNGKERIFTTEDHDPAAPPPAGTLRRMDCVDCHNQSSHSFWDPELALDAAITSGEISRRLPYVRKVGLQALKANWTRDNAREGIARMLADHYAREDGLPEDAKALVAASSAALAAIWLRNIHPEMAITWNTYPSLAGHAGCMRCHDGEHMDADGEAISMECAICHVMVAEKETDPKILRELGIEVR
jgi:hypothetical protein